MFPWACRPVPWQRFPTLGLLTVGGTVPPDPLFAGLMTTVLAYTTGSDVNTALGLAVPFVDRYRHQHAVCRFPARC